MMIKSDMSLQYFKAWDGGADTLKNIIEAGKVEMLESLLEECYKEMTDIELNDLLWFDSDFLYEQLGMEEYIE